MDFQMSFGAGEEKTMISIEGNRRYLCLLCINDQVSYSLLGK